MINNGDTFSPFFWKVIFHDYVKNLLDILLDKFDNQNFKKSFLFWFKFSEELTIKFYKFDENLVEYYLDILAIHIRKESEVNKHLFFY